LIFIVPMQTKVCLAAVLLSGIALYAQNQNPPAGGPPAAAPPVSAPPAAAQTPVSQKPAPVTLKTHTYVRRISAGATLTVLALPFIKDATTNPITTNPPVDALYTSTGIMQRIGWGGQVQAAITGHLAVNAGFLVRRVGYKMNSDIFQGVFNPIAPVDTRVHTVKNEDTRAKFFDFPVVVRYYAKDRRTAGPRLFLEGGVALRHVTRIKTSIDTTVGSDATVCCDRTPAQPALRTTRGFVGGLGLQLIDPVGVRVVPEVRYTRWMGRTFDMFSTHTQLIQVEAMISLTF
jgi:hypothetical protein